MSLIARCPACQTWFKVVPDQLRISAGLVRCGQCGEIFDASQQLSEAESELPEDRQLPSGERTPVKSPEHECLQIQSDTHAEDDLPWDSAALLIKPSAESSTETALQTGTDSEPEATRTSALEHAPAPDPVAIAVTDAVSFMRAPDVLSDSRQKMRRLLWAVTSVLLLLGLLLQVVYRERNHLAALKPEMKPAMQSICEVMGCRILPLQRSEAFVLDSATFHQVDQDTYQLHFVVQNKTRLVLALPALELTLTELTDQAVIRRVLTPAELGVTSETVSAGGEWSATAYLRVQSEPALPRAMGYRLLVFYP